MCKTLDVPSKYGSPSSRASLVAQRKTIRLPVWETQVHSLDQEEPLEEEMATHPVFLPREALG